VDICGCVVETKVTGVVLVEEMMEIMAWGMEGRAPGPRAAGTRVTTAAAVVVIFIFRVWVRVVAV
jgi:hypothetical protein